MKWKKLRCREALATDDGSVFKLDLRQTVEFDWTWEGATAFRPTDLDAVPTFGDDSDDDAWAVWSGEVVEVDEAKGIIFVWVADPDRPPTKGAFYVRPFEFLAFLHSIYCESASGDLRRHLPGRLLATRDDVHPPVANPSSSLPQLKGVWSHSWSVVWGLPGTGKTYTVGRQVAERLAVPNERVLVVSTTNKSTDESAFAIGRAARDRAARALDSGRILRIGKGAHVEAYRDRGLEGILTGTQTDLLHQVGVLTKKLHAAYDAEDRAILRKQVQQLKRAMKDASFNAVASAEVRVVVATAFKAMTLLTAPDIRDLIADGGSPFTTVFIDEAGLISRAAAATLSLLAGRRVVFAGDSKQLAPVSRILPAASCGIKPPDFLTNVPSYTRSSRTPVAGARRP